MQVSVANNGPCIVDMSDISNKGVVQAAQVIEANVTSNDLDLHAMFQGKTKRVICDDVRFKAPRSASDVEELSKLQ